MKNNEWIYGIGKRIKKLRIKLGLSQEELAEEVSVLQSAISKYEREAAYPSLEVLVKLAKVLETTTDYLLGVDN